MSSNINGLNGALPPVGVGGGTSRTSATAGESAVAAASSAGSTPAEVQITDSANLLASVAQQLRSLPAVNEARVAQLRTAVDNGSYTVRPEEVATNLMQFEQSLAQLAAG